MMRDAQHRAHILVVIWLYYLQFSFISLSQNINYATQIIIILTTNLDLQLFERSFTLSTFR